MLGRQRSTSRVVHRLVRLLSVVRPGEGVMAVLLLACVVLLLSSYYLMKTAREGLILTADTFGLEGDELKAYANGAMAVLLGGVVPLYGMLANRVRRIILIDVTYALVIVSLMVFFVLGRAGVEIGLVFFIWLGLVNLLLVAQFWSFAADLYTEEQGKRLFPLIALGGSFGAIFGPRLATFVDTFWLLPVAAAALVACPILLHAVDRLDGHARGAEIAEEPIRGDGGFTLVLRDRYLLLIAIMVLVVNVVNTTGEYILANAVRDHALAAFPGGAGVSEAAIDASRRELIKNFYGSFFSWVNLVSFILQALLVSRVIGKLGVRGALFVMPIVAFGAYAAIGLLGGIAVARIAKIAENGTNYSLQNTVRQTLFLPISRATKYKAKAAIDTFFVRAGDTISALLIAVFVQIGLGRRSLALINVLLVGLWIPLCAGIARRYRALAPTDDAESTDSDTKSRQRAKTSQRPLVSPPPVGSRA